MHYYNTWMSDEYCGKDKVYMNDKSSYDKLSDKLIIRSYNYADIGNAMATKNYEIHYNIMVLWFCFQ